MPQHNFSRLFIKRIMVLLLTMSFYVVICQNYKESVVFHGGFSNLNDASILISKINNSLWYNNHESIVNQVGNYTKGYLFGETKSKIRVFKLVETSFGDIWGISNYGVFKLDQKEGTFEWFLEEYSSFSSIACDNQNNIWITVGNNTIYCIKQDHTILNIKANCIKNLNSLIIDGITKRNEIILKTENEIVLYDGENCTELIDVASISNSGNKNHYKLLDHDVLNLNKKGTHYEFNNKSYQIKYIEQLDKYLIQLPFEIDCILYDHNQSLIEFVYFNKRTIHINKLTSESNNYQLTKSHDIFRNTRGDIITMKKSSDNSFFVYDTNGFSLFLKEKTVFNSYPAEKFETDQGISTRGFWRNSKGNTLVYTYQGIFQIDQEFSKISKRDFVDNKTGNKLVDGRFYSISQQNDSIIWGYGYGAKIYKLNEYNSTYTSFEFNLDKSEYDLRTVVNDLEILNDSTLVLGGSFGLLKFNTKSESFNQISDNIPDGLWPIDLLYDKSTDKLYIGSTKNKGFYIFNMATNKVQRYCTEDENYPLIDNNVNTILKDSDGEIWIGTNSGLQRINESLGYIEFYNKNHGLLEERVMSLLDERHFIWMGTMNGLYCLNKKTNEIISFNEEDGLTSREFNIKSSFKTANENSIIFGGTNGFIEFNPKEVVSDEIVNSLFLMSASYVNRNDQTISIQEDNINKSISIPHNSNDIKFNFGLNNYLDVEKNKIIYKLHEKDSYIRDFNISRDNTVLLKNLKPGKYQLEVVGLNAKNQSSNKMIFDINVKQVFYKKNLFIFGSSFILILIIFLIGLSRRNKAIQLSQFKKELLNLESKSLISEMNPHFIFNTLNGIQNIAHEYDEITLNRYIVSFSKIIRLTMNLVKNKKNLLSVELEYIKSYLTLQNLKLDSNFEYSIHLDQRLNPEEIKIPAMLFQPVIENAIIHGLKPKKKNRKLDISFKLIDNKLHTTIEDNGVGRKRNVKSSNKNHISIGTDNIIKRIELINKIEKTNIEYETIDLSEGTRVIFNIPMY